MVEKGGSSVHLLIRLPPKACVFRQGTELSQALPRRTVECTVLDKGMVFSEPLGLRPKFYCGKRNRPSSLPQPPSPVKFSPGDFEKKGGGRGAVGMKLFPVTSGF